MGATGGPGLARSRGANIEKGHPLIRMLILAALVAAFVVLGPVGTAVAGSDCQTRACHERVAAKQRAASARWCAKNRACRQRVAARHARLCGSPACNRRLGRHMVTRRYGAGAWSCVYPIIDQESGWHHRKGYGGWVGPPRSSAWGIPQALPPSKMASAGADWATNPRTQIRWLLGYFDSRYGGPCAALAHKRATGWY